MKKGFLTFIFMSFFVNIFAQTLSIHVEENHSFYSSSEQCSHSKSFVRESNKNNSEHSDENDHCEIHCNFHHCHYFMSAIALRLQPSKPKRQSVYSFDKFYMSIYLGSIFKPPIS